MDAWVWIVIAVVVIAVIGIAAYAIMQQRRREELRTTFGPEYDQAVASTGDVRRGESDLMARRDRLESLDIRPLSPASRDSYARSWEKTQARFVDDPAATLGQADALIIAVMQDRGYPMDDFEQRAADVSVDHPTVVQNYRAAHDITSRTGGDENVSTEEMRQGLVHYRVLFQELLETGNTDRSEQTDRRATG